MIYIMDDSDIKLARKLTTDGIDCMYEQMQFNHRLLINKKCRTISQLEEIFGKNLKFIRKREKINKLKSEALRGLK